MKRFSAFLLFGCFLTSCEFPIYFENTTVQPLVIEVLIPATGNFIPPPGKILIFPGNKAETRVYVNGAEDTSWRNYGKESLYHVADGVIESLFDSPMLVPVALPKEKIPVQETKLTWAQADALATPDTCASILTIDQCIVVNDIYTEQSTSFYSIETYFRIVTETEFYIKWVLYNREINKYKENDTTIRFRQTTNWNPSPEESFSELPSPEEILSQTAHEAGYAIASVISPLWKTDNRYYFSAGSKEMREAAEYVSSGALGKADSLWSILENSRKKGIAYHAAYNRIIMEEINGDLLAARKKAEDLWKTSKMTEAHKYMQLLEKRIKEKEIILQQTGNN